MSSPFVEAEWARNLSPLAQPRPSTSAPNPTAIGQRQLWTTIWRPSRLRCDVQDVAQTELSSASNCGTAPAFSRRPRTSSVSVPAHVSGDTCLGLSLFLRVNLLKYVYGELAEWTIAPVLPAPTKDAL